MKTTKMLTVLVVALGFLVCSAQFAGAAPIRTAFTYQGHLYDANYAANGQYDFQFKLYNDPCAGIQKGSTITIDDLDVIDAYFTVELDFGSGIFTGYARWLEISIRSGESTGSFTMLAPRQELLPTPYAIYAKTAGGIPSGIIGSGDPNYIPKFTGTSTISDSAIYESNDANIGIGTDNPGAKLEVNGDLKVAGAYRGNIGPNNGAPFPRPAYDSGWVEGVGYVTLFHNIGGNVDNYVVQSEGLFSGRYETWRYSDLTLNSVTILLDFHDFNRVRIWVYN